MVYNQVSHPRLDLCSRDGVKRGNNMVTKMRAWLFDWSHPGGRYDDLDIEENDDHENDPNEE